ncbi:uncharacterized protein LOC113291869 [Papaver somniferum]|uniref:uncharacterized protein LOC113291869 n=1 Tax=Papaver somniferum TaxID=3469 RepID=UPI000E6FD250|nr:uncharacterized protein LOC113291869 [Papaver somniferum]
MPRVDGSESVVLAPNIELNEVVVDAVEPEELHTRRTRIEEDRPEGMEVTPLERDPGLRIPVMQHHVKKRDEIHQNTQHSLVKVSKDGVLGHDESKGSMSRGNFIKLIKYSTSLNEDLNAVVLENAPGNATYTSPKIQKQILNIISNRFRSKIREEIGNAKYCILADESRDASKKEEIVIVLRYADIDGYVQERFFDIQRVDDTCALTLKNGITKFLIIMIFKLKTCEGRGMMSLVICVSMLTSIVNLVTSSSHRFGDFQSAQEDEIAKSLIDKFEATCTTIDHIGASDPKVTPKVGEAQSLQKKTQDIVNAMALVSNTKVLLRELKEEGWENFITNVVEFCVAHGVETPNMEAHYMMGTCRSCQQRDNITVDHNYRVDIFAGTIDFQLPQLDHRFPEDTINGTTHS